MSAKLTSILLPIIKIMKLYTILTLMQITIINGSSHEKQHEYATINKIFSEVPQFNKIPPADKTNIVLGSKILKIKGKPAPFNSSIEKISNTGYLLAFREDLCNWPIQDRRSCIGLVYLNESFEQQGEVTLLNTPRKRPEDPRLFYYKDKLYIQYSFYEYCNSQKTCNLEIGILDSENKLINSINLLYKEKAQEKNWTPFVYKNNYEENLNFIYTFDPLKVLRLDNEKNINVIVKEPIKISREISSWQNTWGEIRGGTPAKLIDNEYLSFFHSSFSYNKTRWFVFGALTFEKEPPFKITRISMYPILFQDCYTTMANPKAFFYNRADFKIIFPCGFVTGKYRNKDVFYLTCGENDSATRLIILDKKALFKNMIEVTYN